jgi:hypothetical protein
MAMKDWHPGVALNSPWLAKGHRIDFPIGLIYSS